MQTPSHVLYFDDILIFYKGVKRELLYVKQLIMEYAQAFGQQINQTKCKFYTCKAAARKIGSIASFLGFSVGCMSFSYLGVPLFLGKLKKVHLHPISYRILNKMATWKGSTLPIMGTVELVKSILDGMKKKLFTVAWIKVYSPMAVGGLGLRSLKLMNKAALLKLTWEMRSSN
ncbi:hypothetical protein Lal_00033420 [Lupinus albus]|nr:hypothetical protein Lal_00033420 [Lupinus albus]